MSRKVPQKTVADSLQLSQTGNDLSFHIKFQDAGDRLPAVVGSLTVIWNPGFTTNVKMMMMVVIICNYNSKTI